MLDESILQQSFQIRKSRKILHKYFALQKKNEKTINKKTKRKGGGGKKSKRKNEK